MNGNICRELSKVLEKYYSCLRWVCQSTRSRLSLSLLPPPLFLPPGHPFEKSHSSFFTPVFDAAIRILLTTTTTNWQNTTMQCTLRPFVVWCVAYALKLYISKKSNNEFSGIFCWFHFLIFSLENIAGVFFCIKCLLFVFFLNKFSSDCL